MTDVRKIGVDEKELLAREENIVSDLIESHEKIIHYMQNELEENPAISNISKAKYIAFCLYHIYQIYKLEKEKLTLLKKFKNSLTEKDSHN